MDLINNNKLKLITKNYKEINDKLLLEISKKIKYKEVITTTQKQKIKSLLNNLNN